MIRKRLGRVVTVFMSAALLGAMALAAGPVSARNPSWSIVPVRLPALVAAGKNAGYFVTVTNGGTSNVNAVTFSAKPPSGAVQAPAYFPGLTWTVGGPEVSCTSSGLLVCDLGTLSAGETFTFTVAYLVPAGWTGTFDVVFSLESASGNTGSDGGTGNHSRGDALVVTSKTGISSSSNFDGGFVVGATTYQTSQTLGRNNKQASTVEGTSVLIPVTIEDAVSMTCDPDVEAQCDAVIGEWSELHVDKGQPFGTAFKVTLFIWGGSVPGGVTASDIVLLHKLDGGTFDILGDDPSEICDSATAPSNPECMIATKVGSNYKIVVWLFSNGGLRGGY